MSQTRITQREKEVLNLLSHGLSTKEIATSLYLSNHTIESHRKNLLNKLEARNTAVLIRRGFETGCLHAGMIGNWHEPFFKPSIQS